MTLREAADPHTIRMARKRHRCERQAHYDRVDPSVREHYGATPCPHGGWIEPGTAYAEMDDGWDIYHPYRYHVDCAGHG